MAIAGMERERQFERGVVVISLDVEQIWGYLDCLTEAAFEAGFPAALQVPRDLLELLSGYRISATWCVVGALSLGRGEGASSPRLAGLPTAWTGRVRAGDERSAPLWYARGFIQRLRDNTVPQEIGLHGGLTHLPWARPRQPRETMRLELTRGIEALAELGIRPTAFTYPRNFEAHHDLLREAGLRCYRGPGLHRAARFRNPWVRSAARLLDEWRRTPPHTVFPEERLPRLWNIPGSMLPFRMNRSGLRLAPAATRVARVRLGVEAAARTGRVFHLWLHPENLAESAEAIGTFEDMLKVIDRARRAGEVEILTMTQTCLRMESGPACPERGRLEDEVARVG
jgi:hypothetical protein